jgi:SAM-dependent methyltransferase
VADDYTPSTYGERIAAVYDEWFGLPADTGPAVDFLAGLAGNGPVLELGIGTGRIALPLAERRVEMHGVDASEAMVAKLREKPGGDRISVLMGDFADVGRLAERSFSLVYVVFNTFFGLLAQEEQVRCFQGVSERLADDGAFVMQGLRAGRHPVRQGTKGGVDGRWDGHRASGGEPLRRGQPASRGSAHRRRGGANPAFPG